jgi:hypothetical protein
MAIFTIEEIQKADEPDFLVDCVIRLKGTIYKVHAAIPWDDAKLIAISALGDGFEIEIEEHTN